MKCRDFQRWTEELETANRDKAIVKCLDDLFSTKTWSAHYLSYFLVVSDCSAHQKENETTIALFLSAQL